MRRWGPRRVSRQKRAEGVGAEAEAGPKRQSGGGDRAAAKRAKGGGVTAAPPAVEKTEGPEAISSLLAVHHQSDCQRNHCRALSTCLSWGHSRHRNRNLSQDPLQSLLTVKFSRALCGNWRFFPQVACRGLLLLLPLVESCGATLCPGWAPLLPFACRCHSKAKASPFLEHKPPASPISAVILL